MFVHGYAVTSYASQGKTVDSVILADSGNRIATNAQQWYVSISRGRKRVVVLTPDKIELRANIQHSGERELVLRDETEHRIVEEISISETRRRMIQHDELIRQNEFIRLRMDQQQTYGIRV